MSRTTRAPTRPVAGGWRGLVVLVGLFFAGFGWNVFDVVEDASFRSFDRAGESLVLGRLAQSRQDGVFSFGGLTGLGRRHTYGEPGWVLEYSPALFDLQYDAYHDGRRFAGYSPYESQVGAQGILFSLLDSWLPGTTRGKLIGFRLLAAILSAIALALIVRWFALETGTGAAMGVAVVVVICPWLTLFAHNLFWSLWAFYLPMIAAMYVLRHAPPGGRRRALALGGAVFASVTLKCLFSGFEYITTTLIMLMSPLVYYHLRDGLKLRRLLGDVSVAAAASILAGFLTTAILFVQIAAVEGRWLSGFEHVAQRARLRTYGAEIEGTPPMDPEASLGEVLRAYAETSSVSLGRRIPAVRSHAIQTVLDLPYWLLGIVVLAASSAIAFARRKRLEDLALVGATWFSVLAPLSWFVLFKNHSRDHPHLNPIVWQMPFTLFACAVLGRVIGGLLRSGLGLRGARIASAAGLLALAGALLAMPGSRGTRLLLAVPDDHATLQAAIDHAAEGAAIRVRPGRYRGPIDLTGKNVSLVTTDGPSATLLTAGDAYAVIVGPGNTGRTRLEGFSIRAAGGVLCRDSSPTIVNNVLEGTGGSESGIHSVGGSPTILRNRITRFGSGGVVCEGGASRILHNDIVENRGSGVRLEGGAPSLEGNRVGRNRAARGGGIHIVRANVVLDANVVARNRADQGGGVFAFGARVELVGNTIAENRAADGLGVALEESAGIMTGTIVWQSGPSSGTGISLLRSALDASHSLVRGGWPGQGNLDADPRFVDPDGDDFHLSGNSPCRGRVPARAPHDPHGRHDFEGEPRSAEHGSDVGADEFGPRIYRTGHRGRGLRILGESGATVHLGFSRQLTGGAMKGRTPGGPLIVLRKPILLVPLGSLPPTGRLDVPIARPPGFAATEAVFVQAMIGVRPTNVLVLEPRNPEDR